MEISSFPSHARAANLHVDQPILTASVAANSYRAIVKTEQTNEPKIKLRTSRHVALCANEVKR